MPRTDCQLYTLLAMGFWLRDFSLVLPQPQGLIAIGRASFGLAKDHLRASETRTGTLPVFPQVRPKRNSTRLPICQELQVPGTGVSLLSVEKVLCSHFSQTALVSKMKCEKYKEGCPKVPKPVPLG